MEHEAAGGYARGHGDVQLPARGHVEQQPLLMGQPGHGDAQERLRGIDDVAGAEGGNRLAGAGSDVILVVNEERGAVLCSQREGVAATDLEGASTGEARRIGQQHEGDRAGHQVDRTGARPAVREANGYHRPARPRSSGDRATASGAVCAGSNPAEGALRFWH